MNVPAAASILPVYISPTLQRLAVGVPEPSPACASCPASMWYVAEHPDGHQLKCFCSRMHVTSWDSSLDPILQCDGRDLGLLAIAEAQAEKEERKAAAALRQAEREEDKKQRDLDRQERKAEAAQRKADREADKKQREEDKKTRKADRKVPAKEDAEAAPTATSEPSQAS